MSTNALWKTWEDHPLMPIKGTQYTIRGFSICALRTNFYIKELNLMLDAGLSANFSPDYILVSHCHSDHSANLPYHLYSAKEGQKIQIYVPSQSLPKFRRLLDSAYELSTNEPVQEDQSCYELKPVKENGSQEMIPIKIRNKPFELEIFPCDHGVPCVGYGIAEVRQKLKPEYQNLPQIELGKLRKSGVELSQSVPHYFLCFLGDTSCKILENNALWKYQTIMIECSFIFDDELPQATLTKHIHWSQLKPFILAHPETFFILYHFSQRYKKSEIKDLFDKENLSNVHAWIN
jgi:ribonuclease Z